METSLTRPRSLARVVVIALGIGLAMPARAECTYGDVRALFQSLPVFAQVQRPKGISSHMVDNIGSREGGPCQQRLFVPKTYTRNAGEYFLAGTVLFWDYIAVGLTRQQALADIALFEEHVYLMETDDDWSYDEEALWDNEVPLMSTGYRGAHTVTFGQVVYRQRGIIEQLPAGRYVLVYASDYPGNPEVLALHPDDADWVEWFSPYSEDFVSYLDVVP